MSGCPVRKLEPEERRTAPALERLVENGWERFVVRTFDVARQVLRDPDATSQAGFGAERMPWEQDARPGAASPAMRPPIIYLEGAQHRRQRSVSARFFAPKVTEAYREMMESLAAELVGRLRRDRSVDLSGLAMEMAVQVAARVVGLTSSNTRAMSRRLNTFFAGDPLERPHGLAGLVKTLRSSTATARFYHLDVKPAIRSRRRRPQEDVISSLLDEGFSDLDVLTECVTYAAAGMVTTRELICMAAWHLLDDPDLLDRYRAADREARLALLSETLRLEPVVGRLHRRVRAPLTLRLPDGEQTLPAGTLVELDLRAVNADAATVGAEPYGLCPGRELPRAVPAAVMSFGDGHHRCPGAPIAIMETEVFVSALFAEEVVTHGPPRVSWNAVTQGYELDRLLVRRGAPVQVRQEAA